MERNLNNEDFEEFLKFKTDHYKLYPSDKVWKGIYQSLHTRKRWFRIGGSLLFLSTLLFVTYQFNDRSTAATPVTPVKPATHSRVSPSGKPAPMVKDIIIAGAVAKGSLPSNRRSSLSLTDFSLFGNQQPAFTVPQAEAAAESGIETSSMAILETSEPSQVDKATHTPVKRNEPASTISSSSERVSHDRNEINWLQEMAAIRLSAARRHRFNLQFYFSPTISYRKLTDANKSKQLSNTPLPTNQLGVNHFVDHKPAIGVELGSNVLFSPTKNLTLKTGLQVNYSRYTIQAYKFYFEKANIALLSAGRVSDTMSSYTSIRNFNGYFPEQLQNQYLQLSLPVGAELKLLGSKRLQLNVAGTVQPSYLLYNDTYLLSSDFINYIKEPSLVRKWNVNTSAEAFVSYYIGGMRWQIGPQFRYQTLSSYNDRYPIKEYLIEYGVKFGVSKTLR